MKTQKSFRACVAVTLFMALNGSVSYAAGTACAVGAKVTTKCEKALAAVSGDATDLAACLNMLTAEYNGENGTGVGKGANYLAKKAECVALAKRVLAGAQTLSALDADDPDGNAAADAESARAAVTALKNWR